MFEPTASWLIKELLFNPIFHGKLLFVYEMVVIDETLDKHQVFFFSDKS